jgi:hypothetical protein
MDTNNVLIRHRAGQMTKAETREFDAPYALLRYLDDLIGRDRVSHIVGISPNVLNNIRNRRAKKIDWRIVATLRDASIDASEATIKKLEAHVILARRLGVDITDSERASLASKVAHLQSFIEGAER